MTMLEGSFLKNKLGPLPTWAWMAIGLGIALAVSVWQKNRAGNEAKDPEEPADASSDYTLPENLAPTYAFVDADTTLVTQTNTWPSRPPGGGRPGPPTVPTKPPVTLPDIKPRPIPVKPAPQPPAGTTVTVVKWAKGQKNGTPSTVWGIAEKVYGKATQGLVAKIWDAPQNATLKKKRGVPDKIQPGDKIWVPK